MFGAYFKQVDEAEMQISTQMNWGILNEETYDEGNYPEPLNYCDSKRCPCNIRRQRCIR